MAKANLNVIIHPIIQRTSQFKGQSTPSVLLLKEQEGRAESLKVPLASKVWTLHCYLAIVFSYYIRMYCLVI